MKKVVIASNNKGKIKEFKLALTGFLEVVTMKDLGVEELPETCDTFVENSIIKARNVAKQSGLPALADDSGIIVDALGGEPGIYSARYAGENCSDNDNIEKILRQMKGIEKAKRTARFCCSIVFLKKYNDPAPIIIQRFLEGIILDKKIGNDGFGYDPIFYLPTHNCTFAQLSVTEKNKISHRGLALQDLINILKIKN
jgi:XTP/dITP diphosphohydrolase